MQFNSEANYLDLYSDCRYFCGISNTDVATYPLKDFTRNANFALDRTISLIFGADNRWQFDDTNQTTELLDVSTNLVANTQKYAISITWLKIHRVRIKDSAGNWITLIPIDRRQLSDAQLTADAGDPKRYDKLGIYLYLHPKSSYASAGGLEIQFQRGASYFVHTDTTKTPGFATQFHRLISLYSALDYCSVNSMIGRVNMIQGKIQQMEAELISFYSSRDADQKITLKVAQDDYGQSALGAGSRSSNPNGF